MQLSPPSASRTATSYCVRSETTMPVPYAAGFRHDPDLGRLVGFEEDPDEDGVREHIRRIAKRAEDGERSSGRSPTHRTARFGVRCYCIT
jgi:hypothetical protein